MTTATQSENEKNCQQYLILTLTCDFWYDITAYRLNGMRNCSQQPMKYGYDIEHTKQTAPLATPIIEWYEKRFQI